MKIENNLLVDDPRIQPYVPAAMGWNTLRPFNRVEFLTWHYTATMTYIQACWSIYSAHIYILPDGKICQRVPLNRVAYHAGLGEWGGRGNDPLYGFNVWSLGIEQINYGFVSKNWKGQWNRDGIILPDNQVIVAKHKLKSYPRGWQTYPQIQLQATFDVSKCLNDYFHFVDMVGHDDVCLTGKLDPGPAFPQADFKKSFYGDELDAKFTVTRWWPGNPDVGLGGVTLKRQPYDWYLGVAWLPAGAICRKLSWSGRWTQIETDDGKIGFMREKYLRRIL